jgi:hypothetical protein
MNHHMTKQHDGIYRCRECGQTSESLTSDELESLPNGEPTILYLASDGKSLTTWDGIPMLRITRLYRSRISPSVEGFRFWARGFGRSFYGTSPGHGMYAKVRASKASE